MAARIKIFGPRTDDVIEFKSFEEARGAFCEMCEDYPETVVVSGVPCPAFRRGKPGEIILETDAPNPIEMDRDGQLYLGAVSRQ